MDITKVEIRDMAEIAARDKELVVHWEIEDLASLLERAASLDELRLKSLCASVGIHFTVEPSAEDCIMALPEASSREALVSSLARLGV